MLDFQKLIPQIAALAIDSQAENDVDAQIMKSAQLTFDDAASRHQEFEARLQQSASTTFWPCAMPLEKFGHQEKIRDRTDAHSVVACDGSQIMPTQHEIASCFLLNIGAVVLHYGEESRATLTSYPFLYHNHDALYPLINKRRIHVDESLVSFERGLKELRQARRLAETERKAGHEVLTLVDGSLIPFNVDRNADRSQEELLDRFAMELDAFNAAELTLIGYISQSRSSDIVNILRVWRCPYAQSRCQIHCATINEDEFPCSDIWPLSDRQLFRTILEKGSRSGFFLSGARASRALQLRNRICFAYINTGQEAARIEIPAWLYEDKVLLNFALSALSSQIIKGNGYPISLSEAHNQAVVKQHDRQQFFRILGQKMMSSNQSPVMVSQKESKKRRGIV